MNRTNIIERTKIESANSILIEGLPGLGMVGRIATQYLVKKLKAKKLAELYSPHFPYYIYVDENGKIRLLRGEFYYWENWAEGDDLMLLIGDSQAQTIEGQYDVAGCILDFAERNGVKTIVTIGGYRKEVEESPKVIAVSSNPELLNRALEAGAIPSSAGNPIVGAAGLLLGLAKFKNINAVCLLAETRGYLPDPKAAKTILIILQKLLGIQVDLSGLKKEIKKSEEIVNKMLEIEKRRKEHSQKMRREEEERITYIS